MNTDRIAELEAKLAEVRREWDELSLTISEYRLKYAEAREQLAAVTRERDEALKDIERWQHGENEQLAAALAREAQLREYAKHRSCSGFICDSLKHSDYLCNCGLSELLATPPDDGPLKAYVAK